MERECEEILEWLTIKEKLKFRGDDSLQTRVEAKALEGQGRNERHGQKAAIVGTQRPLRKRIGMGMGGRRRREERMKERRRGKAD